MSSRLEIIQYNTKKETSVRCQFRMLIMIESRLFDRLQSRLDKRITGTCDHFHSFAHAASRSVQRRAHPLLKEKKKSCQEQTSWTSLIKEHFVITPSWNINSKITKARLYCISLNGAFSQTVRARLCEKEWFCIYSRLTNQLLDSYEKEQNLTLAASATLLHVSKFEPLCDAR